MQLPCDGRGAMRGEPSGPTLVKGFRGQLESRLRLEVADGAESGRFAWSVAERVEGIERLNGSAPRGGRIAPMTLCVTDQQARQGRRPPIAPLRAQGEFEGSLRARVVLAHEPDEPQPLLRCRARRVVFRAARESLGACVVTLRFRKVVELRREVRSAHGEAGKAVAVWTGELLGAL